MKNYNIYILSSICAVSLVVTLFAPLIPPTYQPFADVAQNAFVGTLIVLLSR